MLTPTSKVGWELPEVRTSPTPLYPGGHWGRQTVTPAAYTAHQEHEHGHASTKHIDAGSHKLDSYLPFVEPEVTVTCVLKQPTTWQA